MALAFPEITRRVPRSSTAISVLQIRYADGQGILRRLLQQTTSLGFAIDQVSTESRGHSSTHGSDDSGSDWVEVTIHVHGKGPVNYLAAELSEMDGVEAVQVSDANTLEE